LFRLFRANYDSAASKSPSRFNQNNFPILSESAIAKCFPPEKQASYRAEGVVVAAEVLKQKNALTTGC
jgi:hypothetical protein